MAYSASNNQSGWRRKLANGSAISMAAYQWRRQWRNGRQRHLSAASAARRRRKAGGYLAARSKIKESGSGGVSAMAAAKSAASSHGVYLRANGENGSSQAKLQLSANRRPASMAWQQLYQRIESEKQSAAMKARPGGRKRQSMAKYQS